MCACVHMYRMCVHMALCVDAGMLGVSFNHTPTHFLKQFLTEPGAQQLGNTKVAGAPRFL